MMETSDAGFLASCRAPWIITVSPRRRASVAAAGRRHMTLDLMDSAADRRRFGLSGVGDFVGESLHSN